MYKQDFIDTLCYRLHYENIKTCETTKGIDFYITKVNQTHKSCKTTSFVPMYFANLYEYNGKIYVNSYIQMKGVMEFDMDECGLNSAYNAILEIKKHL